MKRVLAVLVPAALLGVLLGCGKPNDPQPVASNTPAAQPGDGREGERTEAEVLARDVGKLRDEAAKNEPSKDGLALGMPNAPDATSAAPPPGTGAPLNFAAQGQGGGGPGGLGGVPAAGFGGGGFQGGGGIAPAGRPASGPVAGYTAIPAGPGGPGMLPPAGAAPMRGADRPLTAKLGGKAGRPNAPADGRQANGEAKPAAQQPGNAKPDGGKADPKGGAAENPASAEQYGLYRENEFRSPLVAALSTFSADVNTASYSNVRRMLQAGTLPPKDAIFLAEFVNYFPYQYATPRGEDPIEFNLEMGPCPWNRKHHLVRVGVQAQKIDPQKMPARNLVFLMDTSGSMSPPNRLPLAKQAINLVIDQLGEKDTVSIVTYAGDSRIALGPTKGSDKEKIKQVMTNLRAEGSTNGEGGITNAYRLARETFIDGGVNRVILCTDGDFNVGVTGKGELVRIIEEHRKSKVFLTILGFGMGNYKDDTLKELANHGNGHHAYIDSLDEAKKVFVEQGGALVCVAKDVKFQVDFNPAKVAAYRLVGYENRLLKDEDFRNDAKDAGDMSGGHQVTVLYEIVPVGVPIDLPGVDKSKYTIPTQIDPKATDEWLTVKMRYKHPEADVSKELGKPLPGKALGAELSDDFRFAAAAASFGMLLRDSQFRGAMTYAGVLEEAQGCVAADPGGHRKAFLELVKKAKDMTAAKPGSPEVPRDGGD